MNRPGSAPLAPRAVALFPHNERPLAAELARRSAEALAAAGAEVRLLPEDAAAVGLESLAAEERACLEGLDLAISLGGDGTMLRTVAAVYQSGAAVLGVNVGHLGYLTEVEPVDLDTALAKVVAGEYSVEERMVLQVDVTSDGGAAGRWWGLNEAGIDKEQPGRLVRLAVSINGAFFTTYAADGVIVATPTGSTAYSFSAGGPIVSPRHRCLLLTPVAPHMLFDRSLVLDADEEIAFTVTDGRTVVLTMDGRELGRLVTGDEIVCTAGSTAARIVTFGSRDFHQILKVKFGLEDR
ncbi:MAG TPA: NAD(+)/NADH kinase [Acidimicrobiia bacterium]|nr:NAD(+)/NADH kinase [Acidimicrobiia bacterium]